MSCRIELRPAKENDFDGINRVIDNHYSAPPIFFKPAYYSEPRDVAEREDSIIFIAKAQNDVVGFLSMHSRGAFTNEGNEAEIEVVVNPDVREHGIGQQLLMHAIKHTTEKTELKQLIAKIPKGNEPSKRLFRKCNFHELFASAAGTDLALEIVR